MWTPQTLLTSEVERLRILYLAKYATNGFEPSAKVPNPIDGVMVNYHAELAGVLRDLGIHFQSADSFDYLLLHGSGFNYVLSIFNRAPFRNAEVFGAAVCEYLGIAYMGARPHVRALAEDKHLTKLVARALDIPTAHWVTVGSHDVNLRPPPFAGPYFVKPRFGAASEGITTDSVQDFWEDAVRVVQALQADGRDVIVERFIAGANVTLPVLSDLGPPVFLPTVEDVTDTVGGILTYRQNRLLDPGLMRRLFLDDAAAIAGMHEAATALYAHLTPVDYFRIDFRVGHADHVPYLLEINVCCNLGSHSNVAMPASHIGVSQQALVGHIIACSARRQRVFSQ